MAKEMGYAVVAGVDEVGMGPLAGPVVASAVVLPLGVRLRGLDDSKKLSKLARERLDEEIRKRALAVATSAVSASEVDEWGLMKARNLACMMAVKDLGLQVDYLLVDAWDVPGVLVAQLAVVRGDSTVASIMAASIVAKVARDRMMVEYDKLYPGWGFKEHKGYATKAHREALAKNGASAIHRMSWAPLRTPSGNVDSGESEGED